MKPILNLYNTLFDAKYAFEQYHGTGLKNFRELVVREDNIIIHFIHYKSYEDARVNELCSQWGEINFFVDLPENVKNHYLSRIRWVDKVHESLKSS